MGTAIGTERTNASGQVERAERYTLILGLPVEYGPGQAMLMEMFRQIKEANVQDSEIFTVEFDGTPCFGVRGFIWYPKEPE